MARRCADLPDLLAAAAAGYGQVALVSADLRALDRPALHELASHGVEVAGVVAPGDDIGERRLRQLGLTVVLRADLASHEIDDALDSLDSRVSPSRPGEAPRHGSGTWVRRTGAGRRCQVIAVWGPTGAPGRSTVALNLAAELARSAPTLLVDCDTYGSSVAQSFGLLDEAPGVAAAAAGSRPGRARPRSPGPHRP